MFGKGGGGGGEGGREEEIEREVCRVGWIVNLCFPLR